MEAMATWGEREEAADGPWNLPEGWVWAPLDLVAPINPATSFHTLSPTDELPFIPMAAVAEESGKVDLTARRQVRDISKGYVRFMEGDVIFAKITPCMENGKVAPVVGFPSLYAAGSTEFHVLRPLAVDQRYLWYWLVSRGSRVRAKRNMSGSAGQLRVPAEYLRKTTLPLPPLPEQRRIVVRMDELFAEIEEGEAALADARKGLETFRRALLKAAVTGELTADWRGANPCTETGHVFLARIKADHAAHSPANRHGRRAAEKRPSDASTLPALPEGWGRATLGDLSWDSSYGTSTKCDATASGPPVLRIPNIRAGAITYADMKFATTDLRLDAPDYVASGDLLIIRTNGSATLIGRGGVAFENPAKPTYFASYLIRFRLAGGNLVQKWISTFFESATVRSWMMGQIASSAGQYNVSQSSLALMPVPIPPPAEATEILHRVSDALAAYDDTLALLDAEAADAARLKQSILKHAFEGRLVQQDPCDEPAAAMLARLTSTQPAAARKSRGRPRKGA